MEHFFKEKVKLFLGGFFGWFSASLYSLFSVTRGWAGSSLIFEYGIKFFGTIIIGFSGGLVTVMAKDLYDIKIKHHYHKLLKKKDKTEKKK